MAEFLDSFDVERDALLAALTEVEHVWERFQERRALAVDDVDATDSLIEHELALARRDLEATQFNVGIFGLIKRGKSTLLNGLIGREVSAMHVTPETAVPVYVSYGQEPEATVHFADGGAQHVDVDEVAAFTSQKANANNHRGVAFVDQRVPVGFLRNGTRLIDSPGLDDAEADEVYTERTLQELDVVDAGVVLFLSPPTVGATELSFLEEVVARDLKKTFLVCNMYPQHFHDPQVRAQVLDYVGGRIVDASRNAGRGGEVRVYPVCALEAWEARRDGDIAAWKRSGADRLLRDLEGYLSDSAGRQTLQDAADRIVRITEMARSEVKVRQQLLEDPQRLEELRARLDTNIAGLEHRFDDAVAQAMSEVTPLQRRIRSLVRQPFTAGRQEIDHLETLEEVEQFASRFRRQVEVAAELASRHFSEGFAHVIRRLQTQLQERFHAVMTDLAPNLPQVHLSANTLLVTPDQLQALMAAQRRARQASRTGALVGGLSGGGVAFAAGAALLGPIGLVAGALVGWKLADVVGVQRSLDTARRTLHHRLDEVAASLIRDVDDQVAAAVETVRHAVQRRRRAFAQDLYQQFEVVQGLEQRPEWVDAYRRDAVRFIEAFEACEHRARGAMPSVHA